MAKKLNRNVPTERFLQQGDESVIRLQSLAECASLAGPVIEVTRQVRSALEKRRAAEQALIPIRIQCSFADYEWDRTVRAMSAMTESQTGGKKTVAYRELFPNGIGPLVTPSGEGQRVVGGQFLNHLGTCTTEQARAAVEEWKPKLQKAYEGLSTTLTSRAAAETALYVARGEEQAARRDFNRTIDRTIAQVRAAYPEDRARQDLAFPSLESGPGHAGEELETEPEEPGEVTEPA